MRKIKEREDDKEGTNHIIRDSVQPPAHGGEKDEERGEREDIK